MALLFVQFVVVGATARAQRYALALVAQSVAPVPQPIPSRVADAFTE
jgi:hypothetical protein